MIKSDMTDSGDDEDDEEEAEEEEDGDAEYDFAMLEEFACLQELIGSTLTESRKLQASINLWVPFVRGSFEEWRKYVSVKKLFLAREERKRLRQERRENRRKRKAEQKQQQAQQQAQQAQQMESSSEGGGGGSGGGGSGGGGKSGSKRRSLFGSLRKKWRDEKARDEFFNEMQAQHAQHDERHHSLELPHNKAGEWGQEDEMRIGDDASDIIDRRDTHKEGDEGGGWGGDTTAQSSGTTGTTPSKGNARRGENSLFKLALSLEKRQNVDSLLLDGISANGGGAPYSPTSLQYPAPPGSPTPAKLLATITRSRDDKINSKEPGMVK